MKVRMESYERGVWSLSGCLARDLLKAWLIGEPVEVERQIERSLSVLDDARDENETERRTVLRAIASRMNSLPGLLSTGQENPATTLCLQLLGHLACPLPGESRSTTIPVLDDFPVRAIPPETSVCH